MINVFLISNYQNLNPVLDALEILQSKIEIRIIRTHLFEYIDQDLITQIIDAIKSCDVVIADITDDKPNIYYEVGLAHGMAKPVILLSQQNNFTSYSLISYKFVEYDSTPSGIKNLSFRLSEILNSKKLLEELTPVVSQNKTITFNEIKDSEDLQSILQNTGPEKYYKLEKWIGKLLENINGFDVQQNEFISGKEYDFIVWNNTEDRELSTLGNPIPIEVKSSSTISNDILHTLSSKANLQGFKSFILITTADTSKANKKLISELKIKSGIQILVIDGASLMHIKQPKDLYTAIKKSQREFFIN